MLSKLTDTFQELNVELKATRAKIDDLQQQLATAKKSKKVEEKAGETKKTRTITNPVTRNFSTVIRVVSLYITQAMSAQNQKKATAAMRHAMTSKMAQQID